jgi:hypothetical protein
MKCFFILIHPAEGFMDRLRLGVLVAGAVALMSGSAEAALIAYDGFASSDYTLGDPVYPAGGMGPNSGTGWTDGWQGSSGGNTTAPRYVASGLSYSGLASSGYAAASLSYQLGGQSTAERNFTNTATSDLWFSFLIQLNSSTELASGNPNQNYGGIALEDPSFSKYIYVGVGGGATNYGLQTMAAGIVSSTTAPTVGQTELLLVHVDSSDTASLWIDPTLGGAPLGTPDVTVTSPFAPSGFGGLYWSDTWGWTYDELRIGTTLADVTPASAPVPEPPTWTILAGAALLAGWLRARGRGTSDRVRRRAPAAV